MSIEIECPCCGAAMTVPGEGDWTCEACGTVWRVEVGLYEIREGVR